MHTGKSAKLLGNLEKGSLTVFRKLVQHAKRLKKAALIVGDFLRGVSAVYRTQLPEQRLQHHCVGVRLKHAAALIELGDEPGANHASVDAMAVRAERIRQ